jgi:uncharacterized protein YraI
MLRNTVFKEPPSMAIPASNRDVDPLTEHSTSSAVPVMHNVLKSTLLIVMLVAGCSSGIGSRTIVAGAGPDEFLKLRAGPGLGFRVILGLPDGTQLIRRDCITEASQLWCRVSLFDAPSVSGFVSSDYLATE